MGNKKEEIGKWYEDIICAIEDEKTLFKFIELSGVLKGSDPFIIFPWSGGKTKMKMKLQHIFEEMNEEVENSTGQSYEKYIDLFYGGGGSFFALYEDLLFAGVKKVILNDINELLLSVHKNIANNYDEMKSEYIKIVKDKIVKPFGTTHILYEDQIIFYEEIRAEFYELQEAENFGVACSIRFIILTMYAFSGNTKIDNDGKFKFTENSVYNKKGLMNVLTIPVRLKKFNEIYSKFDIEFRLGDAFDLLEEYKNNPNVLLNMDPPYVEEDREKKITKDTIICGVGIEYGQPDFPHERLVKNYLNCTNFIYNNNIHPFLLSYEKSYQLHSTIHDRPNSNSKVKKGTKRNIVREIVLWGNKAL